MFHTSIKFITVLLAVTTLLSAKELSAADKTLTKVDDPIVIEGAAFPSFNGVAPERLSLMVLKNCKWVPIPFQIDQKKPDGSYAFTMGPEASEDPDPKVDYNDELVFMVKDTGDSIDGAAKVALPDGVEGGMEITVTDPKNGAQGWAYLFLFKGQAIRSNEDYIVLEIDEEKGYRWVRSYESVTGAPVNKSYPDYIAPRKNPAGGGGKDVIDRIKMREEFKLPMGVVIPVAADAMIESRDAGYIDGQVRVLHLAYGYLEVAGINMEGMGYSVGSYYPNCSILPITIKMEIPKWMLSILPEVRIAGYTDFNSNVYGSHTFSSANPYNPEIVLDGKMSAAEKAMDLQTPIDWIAGFGPHGGFVSRYIIPDKAKPFFHQATFYIDDETLADKPEDNPGVSGVGFDIHSKKGETDEIITEATYYLYTYIKADLTPDNIQTVLDVLDFPVTTSVRNIDLEGENK